MPTRFIAWLEAQPIGRRRLYSVLVALTLVTLPCYAGGLALRVLDVRPPAAPERVPTQDPRPTPTASATSRIIPTVAAPPTWTAVWPPEEEGEPEPETATPDPAAPTSEGPTPEASPAEAATATPAAPTAGPTEAPSAEPTAEPATGEPPTEAPTAPGPPTEEPTPIGGFTPQPAAP